MATLKSCAPEKRTPDSWYEQLFARFYDALMHSAEVHVLGSRRQALLHNAQGPVLEIGCGTGVNFSYYPDQARVLAIDPSANMLKQAAPRAARMPAEIQLLQLAAEELGQINRHRPAARQFQTIVCTLVLCTVQNPGLVLREIVRLLRPGGRLLVLEHIRSRHALVAGLQRIVRPVWQCCGAGCVLNRRTDQLLKTESELRLVQEEYFSHSLPFYQTQFQK